MSSWSFQERPLRYVALLDLSPMKLIASIVCASALAASGAASAHDHQFQKLVGAWRNVDTFETIISAEDGSVFSAKGGRIEQVDTSGRSELNSPDGRRYSGDYRDHLPNGKGAMTWPDGARYDGQWSDGKRNGHGVMAFPNGERYDGQWSDNELDGQGVYTWPDGRRYDGQWHDGKRNGQGVETRPNGRRYEGQWRDDKRLF